MNRLLPAAVLCLSLLATACSGGGDDTAAPSADPAPTTSSAAPSTSATPVVPPAGSSTPSATRPAAPAQAAPWRACEEGFQCSTLKVPLDRAKPAAGSITLALTRTRATGAKIGSLIVNPGGPGASAIGYLQAVHRQLPSAVRARFDLVAFDPRGVGRTSPVRCGSTSELDRYYGLDPSPEDAAELAAYERGNEAFVAGCRKRSGAVLPFVSTAQAAEDLDAVRAALGDDRLTYLGYSYGTSIGAAYLERFPTRVRAMVLDGAVDPTLTWDRLLEGQSSGFDRALEAFMADCERTRCAFRKAVSGDLLQAYDALEDQVDRSPLRGSGDRRVGPGEFSFGVAAGLYSRSNGWPAIAQSLANAVDGDGAGLLALNDSYLDRRGGSYANTLEANPAVNCIDRPWPKDTASYQRLAAKVAATSPRFGPAIALSGLLCADWPVAPVGAPRAVAGAGSPPVVVIGTTRDPATPYAWSVSLADQLAKGVLLSYEGDGHTVYRSSAPACIEDRVNSYLLTGRAPSPVRC